MSMRFAFCPTCSSPKVMQPRPNCHECPDCGLVLFQNVAAASALILECTDRILVTVRKNDPGRDLLGLPGGFADPGESAEENLRRELREELGLEIEHARYFCSFPNKYFYKGVTYHTLDLFFTASCDREPTLHALDEVKAFQWLRRSEIDLGRFAFNSMRSALGKYLGIAVPNL